MQFNLIQPKENIIEIGNWQEFHRDGIQFLATAAGAWEKGKKTFTPEAIYNLTAMAIEKYIMAFLMKQGDLAENHTMVDLANALERHMGPMPDLRERLLFLDAFQQICDLNKSRYVQPSQEETAMIIAIGKEVAQLLTPRLAESNS